jgi:hypothetical protein
MTGVRFLFRVTLRRLDLAAEIYRRDFDQIPDPAVTARSAGTRAVAARSCPYKARNKRKARPSGSGTEGFVSCVGRRFNCAASVRQRAIRRY